MCRVYQLAECNSFIANTKVQSWRHKRPFLERNKNEIVELYKNTKLAQAISAKFSELKDYTHQK